MNLFGFHTARYHSEYSLPFTIFVKKFYKKLYLLNFSTPSQVSTDTNFILLMSVIPHLLRDMLMTISSLLKMVGMTGFEPAAPTSRTWCATKLRYIPKTFFVKKVLQKNCIIQVFVNLFGFRTARHHISCWCAYQSFAKKFYKKTVTFRFW